VRDVNASAAYQLYVHDRVTRVIMPRATSSMVAATPQVQSRSLSTGRVLACEEVSRSAAR
jgi:hypothetical protein